MAQQLTITTWESTTQQHPSFESTMLAWGEEFTAPPFVITDGNAQPSTCLPIRVLRLLFEWNHATPHQTTLIEAG